ncbi:hypothetical protein SHELI_v1c10020 [Spiroplasma helicoides]|uniref:Uncharacterized protein n=1 Tax=Spiroplasma helicoides TaxID=216938 RepID=A0A1B3SLY6_9MOLU|nr:ABC transporter permease [Spiroplasma helicoides]AOG60949.1 hypothetical protein SHELI_v1c10020 [Spiroplasma helicoides]
MKNIILFNINRNFKNKYFSIIYLICLLAIIAISFYLFTFETNLSQNTFQGLYIGIISFWILLLFYVNLCFISNAMILDTSNGILNLELSKKYRHIELLFYKLFANKIITIPTNCFLMFLLYLGLYIINPIDYDFFKSSLLFGLLTFFVLDLVFSSLLILFCSFKNTRIVYFLSSAIFVFYMFSPLLGKIQQIAAPNEYSQTGSLPEYEIQSVIDLEKLSKNQEGIVYNLMKNFSSLNNDYAYTLSAKPESNNSSCRPNGYDCLYQASRVSDLNYYKYMGGYNYIIKSGLMLDSLYFLNNSPSTNTNFTYSLSPNYQKSKVYLFLINTLYQSNNTDHFKDTFYYKPSKANLSGEDQLYDYTNWLIKDSTIANIKSSLNLTISDSDIKNEVKSLNRIVINDFTKSWYDNQQKYVNNKKYVSNGWIKDRDDEIQSQGKEPVLKLVDENQIYQNSILKNGNKLYMAVFFNLIDSYLSYNSTTDSLAWNTYRYEQIYQDITNKSMKYTKYFISNPFYFHQYLFMYLNPNMGYANEQKALYYSPFEELPVRTYGYIKNNNYEPLEYDNDFTNINKPRSLLYQDLEKIYTKEMKLTNRVVNTNFVIIGYLFVCLLFGSIGIVIYKKVNVI